MEIILEILVGALLEILVYAVLWVLAVIVWFLLLPVSVVVCFPVIAVKSLFARDGLIPGMTRNYRALGNYWIDVGLSIVSFKFLK